MAASQQIRKAILLTKAFTNLGKNSSYFRAGTSAAKAVGASAKHAAYVLWIQVTGSFFVFFAVIGVLAASREYQKWHVGEIGPGRFYLAIVFSVIFGYFGCSSFWRASKLNREKDNGSRSR